MRIQLIRPLLFAFILLALPLGLKAETGKGIGMWVWSRSSFSTPEARQRLIRFCLKHNIHHLDVYTRISHDLDQPTLQDAEAFRELILAAGKFRLPSRAFAAIPGCSSLRIRNRPFGNYGPLLLSAGPCPRTPCSKASSMMSNPIVRRNGRPPRRLTRP